METCFYPKLENFGLGYIFLKKKIEKMIYSRQYMI